MPSQSEVSKFERRVEKALKLSESVKAKYNNNEPSQPVRLPKLLKFEHNDKCHRYEWGKYDDLLEKQTSKEQQHIQFFIRKSLDELESKKEKATSTATSSSQTHFDKSNKFAQTETVVVNDEGENGKEDESVCQMENKRDYQSQNKQGEEKIISDLKENFSQDDHNDTECTNITSEKEGRISIDDNIDSNTIKDLSPNVEENDPKTVESESICEKSEKHLTKIELHDEEIQAVKNEAAHFELINECGGSLIMEDNISNNTCEDVTSISEHEEQQQSQFVKGE